MYTTAFDNVDWKIVKDWWMDSRECKDCKCITSEFYSGPCPTCESSKSTRIKIRTVRRVRRLGYAAEEILMRYEIINAYGNSRTIENLS